ncbi:MAG: sulfatase [Rikenellaceae bacterium]
MKNSTKIAMLVGLSSCVACSESQTAQESKKPNILFVFVDDLGYADVGFNGSTYYETPNIDAMAKESVVFENSYTYPTSSASRAALLTGQQSFRTGVYCVPVLEKGDSTQSVFSRWTVPTDYKFYSEELDKQGYKSIHLGKWHLVGPYPDEELAMNYPFEKALTQPDPADFSWAPRHKSNDIKLKYYPEGRGFDKNVGGTYRGDPALEIGGYKSKTGGYIAPFSNPFIEQKPDDKWLTDRLTDEAIEFMKETKDEPFFINLHYYTVHAPHVQRSEELFDKYYNKEGDPVLGQGIANENYKKSYAKYASMIESLDDNFGRMVSFLKESGLDENTIIVFSSDNGYAMGANNKMRGKKALIYEGGVRVPTFIYWANKVNPRRTQAPVSIVDFFPTFIDFAGVKNYNGVLDGKSLQPLLTQDVEEYKNRPVFWQLSSICQHGKEHQEACTAMRFDNYKLIQYLATGEFELYNLADDPMESINLVEKEPEVAKRLIEKMVNWRKDNNITLPSSSLATNKI